MVSIEPEATRTDNDAHGQKCRLVSTTKSSSHGALRVCVVCVYDPDRHFPVVGVAIASLPSINS